MTDYRVLARTAAARLNALIARFLPHAKPVRYLLVVFVAALVTALSVKCRAGTIMFEAGSTVIRGETPSIGLYMQTPRADRGGDYNYECGLGLVGSTTAEGRAWLKLRDEALQALDRAEEARRAHQEIDSDRLAMIESVQ
nr:hypothetical protein [Dehalococcoidia bacterium]